jgi:hypothetical protein
MSNSLQTRMVPQWVAEGIENAFSEWLEMSGEWLKTAPEYHLTVKVAQHLLQQIPQTKRKLLMEPHVAKSLAEAGGIQTGPNAKRLRAGGRFDIVLGHGDGRPRTIIELKSPLWNPMGASAKKDLHRICRALLQGKASTQLHNGVFALYTSSAVPKRKDATAKSRLLRKWVTEWRPELQSWTWAESDKSRYQKNLLIDVGAKVHELKFNGKTHAWAAVCVQIRRRKDQ